MRTSEKGIDLIKKWEEFREHAYQDLGKSGKWTIGYGHTGNVKPGMRITKEAAHDLLLKDLQRFENRINTHIKVPLNQNQYDALASFDYNTGGIHHSTLKDKLNKGDYHSAFNVELPRWNKVTKNGRKVVSPGLINRRGFEQQLANTPYAEPESEII